MKVVGLGMNSLLLHFVLRISAWMSMESESRTHLLTTIPPMNSLTMPRMMSPNAPKPGRRQSVNQLIATSVHQVDGEKRGVWNNGPI